MAALKSKIVRVSVRILVKMFGRHGRWSGRGSLFEIGQLRGLVNITQRDTLFGSYASAVFVFRAELRRPAV